jgi:enamine deaminase RidA (YjgF/YER057c/UK114 family)
MNLSERHHLIAARISALGVDLGRSEPGGKYASVLEDRGLVQVSGMVPSLDGQVVATGRVGAEVTLEQAQHAAMISTLRCLNALQAHLGDLGRIRRVTKMTVYLQSAPGFIQLSEASNGASETLHGVLAPFGDHARTTVGVFALPRNAVLELDMTVSVESARVRVS